MHLIIIGMPKIGKTTIGKNLAKTLGYNFIDTDFLIESAYKKKHLISMTCSEIFKNEGEKKFRSLEKEAVCAINPTKTTIIATGGGTFMTKECRLHLQHLGPIIYLKASYDFVKKKIFFHKNLPAFLSQKDPEQSLKTIFDKRTKIFEQAASITCDIEMLFAHLTKPLG